MDNAHRSDLVSPWLTPRQASVLERFFAAEVSQHFYLTGGTALAAFHLHHRMSVDLDFILRAGYDFDDLLTKAQTKDLGLHPFYLAGSRRQVRNFRRLPTTTPPLTLPELQHDMLALADRLLDRNRPVDRA